MANLLTPNAISRMSAGESDLKPTVQVMDIRMIGSNQGGALERFRLLISDGVNATQAMLTTQLNELIKSKALMRGSIVQLSEYISNSVMNRQIIIIMSLEIRQIESDIIGCPEPLLGAGPQANGGSAAYTTAVAATAATGQA